MATLYVGGRLFDGEKVQTGTRCWRKRQGQARRAGEFAGFAGEKVDTTAAR
jgi:hypothetical protein